MSGLAADGSWELTPTKAGRWHRHDEEACRGTIADDLRAAGLLVDEKHSSWRVRLQFPSTPALQRSLPWSWCVRCVMWRALSGRPSTHDPNICEYVQH